MSGFGMNRNFIGFDIRKDGLFAVLLKSGFKKSAITGFAYQPFEEPDNLEESLPIALEKVSEVIDLGGASCLVSVSTNEFSYRNIEVPFQQPKKILQVLPYELEPVLPIPVDELAIDFLKITSSQDENKTAVIASSANLAWVKGVIGTFEKYGVTVDGVVPAGYPLAVHLRTQPDVAKSWLLIDLSDHLCNIIIVYSGQIHLIRSIPIEPESVNFTSQLITHLQRTIAGFESQFSVTPDVNRIFISGSYLTDDTQIHQLQQELQRAYAPTNVAEIASDLELDSTVEQYKWDPVQYSPALAAALMAGSGYTGINFRKGTLAPKGGIGEHKNAVIKFAIAASIVSIIFLASLIIETSLLEKRADRLQDQMVEVFKSTFPDAKKIIRPAVADQMRTRILEAKKTAIVPIGPELKIKPIDVLKRISQNIPANLDIKLTKLVTGDQGILISGTTDSFNAVDELKTKLENIDGFESVKINSANMERSGNRVRYKIKIQ